jgi:hypothetical protein
MAQFIKPDAVKRPPLIGERKFLSGQCVVNKFGVRLASPFKAAETLDSLHLLSSVAVELLQAINASR